MGVRSLVCGLVVVLALMGCASSPRETTEASISNTKQTVSETGPQGAAREAIESSIEQGDAVADAGNGSQLICKRERVTGSHFSQRVCRTRAEIDAIREAHQKAIQDAKTNGFGGGGPTN